MRRFRLAPPVIVLFSATLILGILLFAVTYRNLRWERQQVEAALLREAAMLVRTVEAGARTGMMGMMWGERELQALLEEAGRQSDVIFIALLDDQNRIVAHSDADRVGERFSGPFPPVEPGTKRRVGLFEIEGGRRVFVLAVPFRPAPHPMMSMHWRMMGRSRPPSSSTRTILVALNPKAYEQWRAQEMKRAFLTAGVLLLVGSAGLYLLFVLQQNAVMQRALHQLNDYTRRLVQNMPIGLLSFNREGRVVTLNPAAERILGRRERELRNRPYREVWDCTLLEALLRGERTTLEREVECTLSDGRRVPLGLNATVLKDEQGNITDVVCLFRDLTEIKRLQAQVRRADRLAAVGQFAAGIAHEIRNPLNTLKGFAQYLHSKMPPDDPQAKYTQLMMKEAERLNRIITELLDFTRTLELHRTEVDVRALLEETLALMERDAQSQHIKVLRSFALETLSIIADPEKLKQVLLNLFLNAFQAMPDGGTLQVATRATSEYVEITVSDSGCGIAREDLPHIFDPFFSRKKGGTGLGLAMVHRILEAHGGTIDVESLEGAGTTFTLRLPKRPQEEG